MARLPKASKKHARTNTKERRISLLAQPAYRLTAKSLRAVVKILRGRIVALRRELDSTNRLLGRAAESRDKALAQATSLENRGADLLLRSQKAERASQEFEARALKAEADAAQVRDALRALGRALPPASLCTVSHSIFGPHGDPVRLERFAHELAASYARQKGERQAKPQGPPNLISREDVPGPKPEPPLRREDFQPKSADYAWPLDPMDDGWRPIGSVVPSLLGKLAPIPATLNFTFTPRPSGVWGDAFRRSLWIGADIPKPRNETFFPLVPEAERVPLSKLHRLAVDADRKPAPSAPRIVWEAARTKDDEDRARLAKAADHLARAMEYVNSPEAKAADKAAREAIRRYGFGEFLPERAGDLWTVREEDGHYFVEAEPRPSALERIREWFSQRLLRWTDPS